MTRDKKNIAPYFVDASQVVGAKPIAPGEIIAPVLKAAVVASNAISHLPVEAVDDPFGNELTSASALLYVTANARIRILLDLLRREYQVPFDDATDPLEINLQKLNLTPFQNACLLRLRDAAKQIGDWFEANPIGTDVPIVPHAFLGRFDAALGGLRDSLRTLGELHSRQNTIDESPVSNAAQRPEFEADAAKPTVNKRKPTCNERMKAEMASNLETVKGWTAQQWADHLGYGKSTINETETWKSLTLLRQQVKAEKRRDRHGTKPV